MSDPADQGRSASSSEARERRRRAGIASLLGRRAIRWLVAAVVVSLTLAFIELGLAVFFQLFLKSVGVLNEQVDTSRFLGVAALSSSSLALGVCVLAFVRARAQVLVGQSAIVSMEGISARLRRIALWEMLLRPSRRSVSSGEVNARVGDLAAKTAQFCFSGALFGSAVVQVVALAAVTFATAPRETLLAFVGLAGLGTVVVYLNRLTRGSAAAVPLHLRVLTDGVARVTRNMFLVRALRTQVIEHRRLTAAVDAYERLLVRAGYLGKVATAGTPFGGVLLILAIVAVSRHFFGTPGIALLAFVYLFVRIVQVAASGVAHLAACNTLWPSFKDSLDYVASFDADEVDAAVGARTVTAGTARRPPSDAGEAPTISVRGVAFAYPDAASEVLRDISVEVPARSQLAIVGASGCGKTTLLALVLGLLEPARGEVLVDGRSPEEFFADPRVRVGYVGAEAFLVEGSLRENLRYGLSADAGDAELWTALRQARLDAVVEALPGKLDYRIAEDGSGLSAGQKQRLCLARALANRPHLLVLDEMSANLDAETEREVAVSLEGVLDECTTIVVSHRDAMLQFADQVVRLG